MKIPENIPVFGEKVKGCKIPESAHMKTFFNTLRREHPEYGAIALHIRNEGNKTPQQVIREKVEGMVTGASDIVIPGRPSFVCELKSQSTRATISDEQISYLLAAQAAGAFSCVAIGYTGAMQAFYAWIKTKEIPYCQK